MSKKLFYGKNLLKPNFYLFNLEKSDLSQVKTILFAFNDPEYMHLGDHLFFIPVIQAFIANGYSVEIAVTPPMVELFRKLGLPVVKESRDCGVYDLIISRFELIPTYQHSKSLLVHVSQGLTKPICSQLLEDFANYFNLTLSSQAADYANILFNSGYLSHSVEQRFSLPLNRKLVFFSLYCDASAYLLTRAKKDKLLKLASEYAANKDNLIVLVGSERDRQHDSQHYPFEYLDLRGKTSILDIFMLVRHPGTILYIGFDAFVMHVFSLLKKPSLVLFRGRISKKQDQMLRKFHVNMFTGDNFVKLIEVNT